MSEDELHIKIHEIIMENGFLIKQENWNTKQMELRATYDTFRITNLIEPYASHKCKEAEKQAYIDGTNSCHKAFQPLLKSALKKQRDLCADEIIIMEGKIEIKKDVIYISKIVHLITNAPEPKL